MEVLLSPTIDCSRADSINLSHKAASRISTFQVTVLSIIEQRIHTPYSPSVDSSSEIVEERLLLFHTLTQKTSHPCSGTQEYNQ